MMLSGIRLFPVLTVGGSEAMSQARAIAAVFPVGEGMRIAVNPAAGTETVALAHFAAPLSEAWPLRDSAVTAGC